MDGSRSGNSLGGNAKLDSLFALLFSHFTEEGNLLFVGWLPLVITFECALEMSFDVYIEGLWL